MKQRAQKFSPKVLGVLVIVLFLLVGWAAFQKEAIASAFWFNSETIKAEFGGRAKLIADDLTYVHQVKFNGVIVGKVHNIEETDNGTMIATLLVEKGTREKLGTAPTAEIRPTLVTDGVQNVLLYSGGAQGQPFTEDRIPLERTKLPVALDDVLTAISSKDAIKGVRTFISRTDATLKQGGGDAVRGFVSDAPLTLQPAGVVLNAFRGTESQTDLTRLVDGFEHLAEAMNRNNGQFSAIVRDLDTTTGALAAGSRPLSESISTGPETLRVTRAGMADLRPALDKLKVTSEDFRPSARELDDFLDEFGPALKKARPPFNDLRDVLKDLRPVLHDLVPTMDRGDEALQDVKGVVFDRLNGPIKDELYSPLKMQDKEYKGSNSPYPFYADIGYFLSNSASVWQHYDSNQAIARLEAGGNGQTVGGTKFPKTFEEYLEDFGLQRPIGPNPDNGPLPTPSTKNLVPDNAGDLPKIPAAGPAAPANPLLPKLLKSPLGGNK
jgi:phospholipid/cholesterol/gamma-HCH transport system substrate-binding protein